MTRLVCLVILDYQALSSGYKLAYRDTQVTLEPRY